MKQGTANLAEDYCFIHKALRPVTKARRQIAAVPPSNCRGAAVKFEACITIPPPEKRQIIAFKTKYHVRPPIKKLLCCNLVYLLLYVYTGRHILSI